MALPLESERSERYFYKSLRIKSKLLTMSFQSWRYQRTEKNTLIEPAYLILSQWDYANDCLESYIYINTDLKNKAVSKEPVFNKLYGTIIFQNHIVN